MQTYIVFLRGINVSGKNIIKMADLKKLLSDNNFENVQTYIQSGNIVLNTLLKYDEVAKKIQQLIEKEFHLNIAVFVLTVDEVMEALHLMPYPIDAPANKVFITFLNDTVNEEAYKTLKNIDFGADTFEIKNNILYFYLPEGMSTSKLTNTFFEKKLKVTATGRNLNTIRKILALVNTK